jgi:hypothetical protein
MSTTETINATQFLNNLVEIAQKDLSLAHVTQHGYGAELVAKLGQLELPGPGSYSVVKPTDTVKLHNHTLTGCKYWVSNMPNVGWAALHIRDSDLEQLVVVKLDNSTTNSMITTMGMENTLTGHITFNQTPCHVICNTNDTKYFTIRRLTSLGFIANYYGLALGLYNDVNQYTLQQDISCQYIKEKLRLQLDVMKLLWDQLEKEITLKHQEHFYWQQKNIIYAFAKKCLLEICQFTTEITGSGLYNLNSEQNQRYRDALIYCTHMKNLYFAVKN